MRCCNIICEIIRKASMHKLFYIRQKQTKSLFFQVLVLSIVRKLLVI